MTAEQAFEHFSRTWQACNVEDWNSGRVAFLAGHASRDAEVADLIEAHKNDAMKLMMASIEYEQQIDALRIQQQAAEHECQVAEEQLETAFAEIARLTLALAGYGRDPQTCTDDTPCVSHMAYLELEAAQNAAVAEMQERCAKVAETEKRSTGPDMNPDDEVDMQSVRIADAIRALK